MSSCTWTEGLSFESSDVAELCLFSLADDEFKHDMDAGSVGTQTSNSGGSRGM